MQANYLLLRAYPIVWKLLCVLTFQIEGFYLFTCPFGLAQKLEAGTDTWVVVKAVDTHSAVHFFPTKMGYKVFQHRLQGDAMQRIVLLGLGHAVKIAIIVMKMPAQPFNDNRLPQ